MTYTHLRDIIIQHKGDKKYVLDKIISEKLSVAGTWYVIDWPEPCFPPYAPATYPEFIARLDGQQFEYEGQKCETGSRIVCGGRIYTNIALESGVGFNYQNLSPKERASFTVEGKPLVRFDASASQLRVALALKGVFIPMTKSPWDELCTLVEHNALNDLSAPAKRKVVKRIALMAVKKITDIDVIDIWDEETGIAPRPSLVKLKAAIESALYLAYPQLLHKSPLIKTTPDGYSLCRESSTYELPVKCRKIKADGKYVDTRYHIPIYSDPTPNNVIEGMEALVLREVIRSLPADAPVLTCHDEIVTLPEYKSRVQKEWGKSLERLASMSAHVTS